MFTMSEIPIVRNEWQFGPPISPVFCLISGLCFWSLMLLFIQMQLHGHVCLKTGCLSWTVWTWCTLAVSTTIRKHVWSKPHVYISYITLNLRTLVITSIMPVVCTQEAVISSIKHVPTPFSIVNGTVYTCFVLTPLFMIHFQLYCGSKRMVEVCIMFEKIFCIQYEQLKC